MGGLVCLDFTSFGKLYTSRVPHRWGFDRSVPSNVSILRVNQFDSIALTNEVLQLLGIPFTNIFSIFKVA